MISTGKRKTCGEVIEFGNVAVNRSRKTGDIIPMNIPARLITTATRKFEERPAEREPAARMILLNAIRLCITVFGREKTRELAGDAMREVAQ